MNLHDPFNRSRLPVDLADRRQRVQLLKEAASALLEGRSPSRQAGLFVGGAISAWLQQGGRLERDFLAVRAPRGCHDTPQHLARKLQDADE